MKRALECVEASFRAQHEGQSMVHPRHRIFLPSLSFHYMAAALPESKVLGMKVYTSSRAGYRFFVLLYDAESGELLAMMEADQLGRIRTGAASGVATKYLARSEARSMASIGAGRQARTQLEAVSLVRALEGVRVFSRNREKLGQFCREMQDRLQLEVSPAASVEEAVRFGDIVSTATNSREPVLQGEWLRAGAHVNAIGANLADRRELDDAALRRASLVAVDLLDQAKKEAGDLILGLASLPHGWKDVCELQEIVGGARAGRNSADEVTIFKSSGIALWDVAVAKEVYAQAMAQSRGRSLELSPSA